MKIYVNIKKVLVFILLLCGILFGILVSYNSYQLAEKIDNKMFIIFMIFFIWWGIYWFQKNCIVYKYGFYRSIQFLSIAVVISSVFRFDTHMMISGISAIMSLFILSKFLPGQYDDLYTLIIEAYVLACCIAIYRYSITSFNSQGVIYAFAGVMFLNYLCYKNRDNLPKYLLCVITEIIILSITRSRTSMLAFLIVAFITYIYLFVQRFTIKQFLIITISLLMILYFSNNIETYFAKIFFGKWGNQDITSNRIYIWKDILSRISFWGYGYTPNDAHNVFFEAISVNGILAAGLYLVVIILLGYRILHVTNKICYINFYIAWLVISLFENLDFYTSRMIPVTFLFFIHTAGLLKEDA